MWRRSCRKIEREGYNEGVGMATKRLTEEQKTENKNKRKLLVAKPAKDIVSAPITDELQTKVLGKDFNNAFRGMLIVPYEHNNKVEPVYKHIIANFLTEAVKKPNSRAGLLLGKALLCDGLINEIDAKASNNDTDREFLQYRLFQGMFYKQREVVNALPDNKFFTLMCSRRAGKTDLAKRLLLYVTRNPNSPVLYIGLTKGDAIELIWDELIELITETQIPATQTNKVKGLITFPNGSKICIEGNSNIPEQEDLRGKKNRLIIIDDAQSQRALTNLIDNILIPTMADYADSKLFLMGTPPRVRKTYFENAWNSGKWNCFHWTAADNPYMPNWEQTIKTVCELKGIDINAPLIQREYYGRIAYDTEALVFANFKSQELKVLSGSYLPENPIEPVKLTDGIRYEIPSGFIVNELYGGIDWGYTDKASCVLVAVDKAKGRACVIYECKRDKLASSDFIARVETMHKYALALKQQHASCSRYFIMADTNEKALTMELYQKYKMPMQNAYKIDSVIHLGIMADLLRVGQLIIPQGSALEDEFERIVYKRDEQDNILHEIDDKAFHPDITMSLLYAVRYWLSCVRPEEARFAVSEVEK